MDKTKTVKGICGICPAGCWVNATLAQGKIVGISADPDHPLGMLCHRGEHAPEIIYSEKRLRYPMRRTGPKGSYTFERISWDQAYDIIVENLNHIKEETGPEAVSIYTGRGTFELSLCDIFQPKEAVVSSASSVLFPFGSPNTMGVGALCYVSYAMIAPHVTFGRMLVNMFADIENAEFLLVWGTNPATDSPPLDMHRLEAAAGRGARITVIDPRRTETAERTGAQWIPIRPGTDGALALSMLAVMIDEELYDESFVEQWTHGFKELCAYVQHFPPETAETITGVPADTIRELTHRIVDAAGAAPVMYTGLEYANSGLQTFRAIFTIWALAGQLDLPGGLCFSGLGNHFPVNRNGNIANPDIDRAVARDRFPLYTYYRGESHAAGLTDAVLKGEPYPIKGLIIHGASLLTSWPETKIWEETLAKLDFIVSIDRQLTADAKYADIVLPATTMFEINSYVTYGPIFRLREKIIEPVGEARNDYLIMANLAERLGYGRLYPQTEEALVAHVLEGSGFTPEQVRAAGGQVKLPTPMMEYKKWEKGGCRPDGKPGFDTPTGKFEIYSTILEEYGYEPLPKYIEPREGPVATPALAKQFPLVFNSGARPQTDFRSQHHGIEGLLRDNPEPSVEINTADAATRHIHTGDQVEVRTLRGSVRFRAQVTDNIVQGAIEANMGGGGPVGPKAWRESNVNLLTDLSNYDEISGFPVYKCLLCEVIKTGDGDSKAQLQERAGVCGATPVNPVKAKQKKVYLDNNATTGLAPEAYEAMRPYLDTRPGNPSSLHELGRKAREGIETARRRVARLIHCRPRRILFTGGGSEADNLALKGVAFTYAGKGKHIITTAVEHPAVLNSCRFLEKFGYQITYLEVDGQGRLDPARLKAALREDTILASVMLANNETGTLFPIKEMAAICKAQEVLFHCDAVQAAGKIDIDVTDFGIDLLTLSGHKFHGPKGVGALFVQKGITLEPLVHGGKQENGLRAGTENVPAIVGMGKAAELAARALGKMERTARLRDRLHREITQLVPNARLNGHPGERLPNTLNLTLPALRGESLVTALDQKGVMLSSGSACQAGSPKPSHALLAMGMTPEDAHCAVRFSLSSHTTETDVDYAVNALKQVLAEMETTVRFLPCK
ncbi:MAG: aminotransferase class V-fold PLP-dependent enzyme [Gammaproteobacteria bacterium]|nr:aminotransferase class V-fold PLP-dependent enzyme [Gammaproteobacteria bacterium]